MNTVYKYPIYLHDRQLVDMPWGAKILSVGYDPSGQLVLWAAVDTANLPWLRRIVMVGTGNTIPTPVGSLQFIGTVVQAPFVWHVFEDANV